MRGEADFNQLKPLWNQLVIGAGNVGRKENFSLLQIPSLSKDMDKQLKLAYSLVNVVDRANRKICVTLLRYNVGNPENASVQVGYFVRKTENKNSQQNVYKDYNIENLSIYLMYSILYIKKILLIHPFEMSHKK